MPPSQLANVWPSVSPQIMKALQRGSGEYTLHDVAEQILTGKWQLWSDGNSVCCTSVVQYPSLRVLYVHLGSGEIGSVVVMWPSLQDFARRNNCTKVQFMGRPGWRKSGAIPDGWRHTHDVVTVEVG